MKFGSAVGLPFPIGLANKGGFTILRLPDVINPMFADFRTRALAERVDHSLDIGANYAELSRRGKLAPQGSGHFSRKCHQVHPS